MVIGVGNTLRHDDAAGLEVARLVRALVDPAAVLVMEHEGEPLGLIERWRGARAVVLVDAIHRPGREGARAGGPPGATLRLDASLAPLDPRIRSSSSTHAVGVGEVIELARALGRLPPRVVLYGVEGARFDAGSGLSEPVSEAIPALADAVAGEASSQRPG